MLTWDCSRNKYSAVEQRQLWSTVREDETRFPFFRWHVKGFPPRLDSTCGVQKCNPSQPSPPHFGTSHFSSFCHSLRGGPCQLLTSQLCSLCMNINLTVPDYCFKFRCYKESFGCFHVSEKDSFFMMVSRIKRSVMSGSPYLWPGWWWFFWQDSQRCWTPHSCRHHRRQ